MRFAIPTAPASTRITLVPSSVTASAAGAPSSGRAFFQPSISTVTVRCPPSVTIDRIRPVRPRRPTTHTPDSSRRRSGPSAGATTVHTGRIDRFVPSLTTRVMVPAMALPASMASCTRWRSPCTSAAMDTSAAWACAKKRAAACVGRKSLSG
ncbi:MAG: hypothetical protein QM820_24385 [Minicystis sp.]